MIYTVATEKEMNNMNSKAYIAGFLCGLLAVALAGIIIHRIYKKKYGVSGNEYDERQKAIRGTAYQYAYLTLLCVLVLGSLAEVMLGFSWTTLFPFTMLGMWISICVFVGYCVMKDAYFTLRSKRKAFILIFLAVGAFNLFIAGSKLLSSDGFVTNGQLNYAFVNFITGISVLLLDGVMILKAVLDRRRGDGE